jgi:hypothetical protein
LLAEIIADSQSRLQNNDKGYKKIDPKNFSWKDVQKGIDQGVKAYNKENGPVKRGFRKLGDNAETFEKWVRLLPEGNIYTGTISGAFQVVLSVSLAGDIHMKSAAYDI